ncbi:MAG TPA: serine hydrolase domain-containing protein [Gemmatimonadales bacterium]|jgi:CubicO group peptidase (beta-lactamase class C family)|nr:serine hydrolase domain-containing protein [Gemmatimonadales bacterium]
MRLAPRLLLLLPLAASPLAAQLPRVAPEAAGLSSARLRRIRPMLDSAVATGEVTGVVTLLARNGSLVELDSAGYADREAGTPMRSNTLFRLASMTKAITSVAAMILVEDGKLLLSDPVSRYLPAFRQMRVAVPGADSGKPMTYEPAARQITIRDLLTHRSGLAYGFLDEGPVGDGYRAAGITDGIATRGMTTAADNVERLAQQPLVFQPGSRWSYALNTDVLGRVVEVVSGRSLADFMQERIFSPLGMHETGFWVSDANAGRLVVPYMPDSTGRLVAMRSERQTFSEGRLVLAGAASHGSRTFFSGGAGLVGTGGDYLRFLTMLANGGELDGVRLLSRKTVELMTASHTGDLGDPLGPGNGFGLGFEILVDPGAAGEYGSPGTYSWGGIYGTTFWVDPREHLVGIVMIQRFPTTGTRIRELFRALAYSALMK